MQPGLHRPEPPAPIPTQPPGTPAPTAPPVEEERGPVPPVKEPGPTHAPERVQRTFSRGSGGFDTRRLRCHRAGQ